MRTNERPAVHARAAMLAAGLAAAALPAAFLRSASAIQDPEPSMSAERELRNAGDGYAAELIRSGRATFRLDTFGDEAFWGGQLRLHEAIAGEKLGGVGAGREPGDGPRRGPEGRRRRPPGEPRP